MTQAQLIDKIAEETKLSKPQAKAAFDATVGAIKFALDAGENVRVPGIGTLTRIERESREYRVPGDATRTVTTPKRLVYKLRGKKVDAE